MQEKHVAEESDEGDGRLAMVCWWGDVSLFVVAVSPHGSRGRELWRLLYKNTKPLGGLATDTVALEIGCVELRGRQPPGEHSLALSYNRVQFQLQLSLSFAHLPFFITLGDAFIVQLHLQILQLPSLG